MSNTEQEQRPDYYSVLNVPPTASIKEIQDQYRRLAKLFHPDVHPDDPWYDRQLKLYNEAYALLSDPARKIEYDQSIQMKVQESNSQIFEFASVQTEDSEESITDSRFEFDISTIPVPTSSEEVAQIETTHDKLFVSTVVVATERKSDSAAKNVTKPRQVRLTLVLLALMFILFAAMRIFLLSDDSKATAYTSKVKDTKLSEKQSSSQISRQTVDATQFIKEKRQAWERYQKDQRLVNRLIQHADNLSSLSSHVGTTETRTTGSNLESKSDQVYQDVSTLNQQLTLIQSQFDDIQFSTGSDDNLGTLQEINQELDDIEQHHFALYKDLGSLTR